MTAVGRRALHLARLERNSTMAGFRVDRPQRGQGPLHCDRASVSQPPLH
jgi:hypothetical protein